MVAWALLRLAAKGVHGRERTAAAPAARTMWADAGHADQRLGLGRRQSRTERAPPPVGARWSSNSSRRNRAVGALPIATTAPPRRSPSSTAAASAWSSRGRGVGLTRGSQGLRRRSVVQAVRDAGGDDERIRPAPDPPTSARRPAHRSGSMPAPRRCRAFGRAHADAWPRPASARRASIGASAEPRRTTPDRPRPDPQVVAASGHTRRPLGHGQRSGWPRARSAASGA